MPQPFISTAFTRSVRATEGSDCLRQMLPGPDLADYERRGQLPVFIPNYYRGAFREHPRTAGRSSQLFNTGTVAWVYRCLVEGLFGIKGNREGLVIDPQLPSHWSEARGDSSVPSRHV